MLSENYLKEKRIIRDWYRSLCRLAHAPLSAWWCCRELHRKLQRISKQEWPVKRIWIKFLFLQFLKINITWMGHQQIANAKTTTTTILVTRFLPRLWIFEKLGLNFRVLVMYFELSLIIYLNFCFLLKRYQNWLVILIWNFCLH